MNSLHSYIPLADKPTEDDLAEIGLEWRQVFGPDRKVFAIPDLQHQTCFDRLLVAKLTREQRPPRSGEWFASGAIAQAYRANNDLSATYWIAKLVVIRRSVTYREEPSKPLKHRWLTSAS